MTWFPLFPVADCPPGAARECVAGGRVVALFNVAGGLAWVLSFTLAGYWFGGLPVIQRNFHFVILAILVISVIPAVVEFLRARAAGRAAAADGPGGPPS